VTHNRIFGRSGDHRLCFRSLATRVSRPFSRRGVSQWDGFGLLVPGAEVASTRLGGLGGRSGRGRTSLTPPPRQRRRYGRDRPLNLTGMSRGSPGFVAAALRAWCSCSQKWARSVSFLAPAGFLSCAPCRYPPKNASNNTKRPTAARNIYTAIVFMQASTPSAPGTSALTRALRRRKPALRRIPAPRGVGFRARHDAPEEGRGNPVWGPSPFLA
jgi:hypothetical protein